LAPEAFLPVRQVGVQFHAASEGVAATDGVFEVLDEAAGLPAGAQERSAVTPNGAQELRVEDLRVRDLPAVSFTAAPGTITLIEGPSGSGKSSLIAALRGVADFEGTATLGGVDVRDLNLGWLAWAGQAPGLIRGTIAANVSLGADPDVAAIRAALDAACADDLDQDRELGVQGSGLSG